MGVGAGLTCMAEGLARMGSKAAMWAGIWGKGCGAVGGGACAVVGGNDGMVALLIVFVV